MIAPSVATRMDQTLKPVAPAPPRILTMKPPMEAPTIPMRTVMMKPPGPDPGMIHLANSPAMSPTNIQEMIPIFLYSLFADCFLFDEYSALGACE